MASHKGKWKGSLQKARRLSQGSPTYSRKTSLIEEETSAKELEEYLETLKKKSGIKSLWRGQSFDKVVRDDEDKTPDISILSMEDDDESLPSENGEGDSDDDFKPKIQMFSRSATSSPDNSSESSINPMKGLQMAEFAFSDGEVEANVLANNRLEDQLKTLSMSDKDVRSVVNNLTVPIEVETEDEVEEEIEENHIDNVTATRNKQDVSGKSPPRHSSADSSVLENRTPSPRTVSERDNRSSRNNEKRQDHSKQSYTSDFSSASEAKTVSSKSCSQTHSEKSRSGRSSASSNSSRSFRSSASTRSSRSSRKSRSHGRSTRRSTSDYSKSESTGSSCNRYTCDVGTQTVRPMDQFSMPPGLGVGMAGGGASLGMQYVDPTPIATHTVSAEALEAVTAYNPSIVVLNNMLREQIRLVEQFVNINQRMYESYCSGMNNNYRYTTLEDTQEEWLRSMVKNSMTVPSPKLYIRRNRPKILSFEEALEQVTQEDR